MFKKLVNKCNFGTADIYGWWVRAIEQLLLVLWARLFFVWLFFGFCRVLLGLLFLLVSCWLPCCFWGSFCIATSLLVVCRLLSDCGIRVLGVGICAGHFVLVLWRCCVFCLQSWCIGGVWLVRSIVLWLCVGMRMLRLRRLRLLQGIVLTVVWLIVHLWTLRKIGIQSGNLCITRPRRNRMCRAFWGTTHQHEACWLFLARGVLGIDTIGQCTRIASVKQSVGKFHAHQPVLCWLSPSTTGTKQTVLSVLACACAKSRYSHRTFYHNRYTSIVEYHLAPSFSAIPKELYPPIRCYNTGSAYDTS